MDRGDTPHDLLIPFSDSEGSSSGTTPAPLRATHDDRYQAANAPSQVDSPPNVQGVDAKSRVNVIASANDPFADPNLRQTTWGIFQVAYDASSAPLPSFSIVAEYWTGGQFLFRFLKELWSVDSRLCFEYYICTLWMIVSPSFSLCFAYLVLLNVRPPPRFV
jgi:hypothetical protein